MKKRLLLVAFAMLSVATSFAFGVGDYAYNSTQRFKITGENLVKNGNFASGLDGWYGADTETAPSAEVWSISEDPVGPNGEKVVESIAPTEGMPLCNVWTLEPGSYVVSYQVKATTASNIASGNADFFINTTGALTHETSTDEAPVTGVASMVYVKDDWKTIVFFFTIDEGQKFVMRFHQLAAGTQITNVEIHAAQEVYDVRKAQNRIALAKELMENPAFNVDEAVDAKENLQGLIKTVEDMIAQGQLDDASEAEGIMTSFETEGLEPFLAVTSVDVKNLIPGLDIASLSNWGRAGKYSDSYKLALSGNWGHLDTEKDVLRSAIQNGFAHSATYAAYHEDFPAGKYFFTCEVRNANTGKTSWPTEPVFNLRTDSCLMFIGTDTITTDAIEGEEFQRFSMVADVKEDGKFRAGIYWPGVSSGGAFFIRNTIIRSFNKDLVANVERIQVFKDYLTQWNAAIGGRKSVHNLIDNANYPWGQNELKAEADRLDPIFTAQADKKWVTIDGADTDIASVEDLKDWTLYQGIEEYTEPAEEGAEPTRKTYQLVRGYQTAANTIKATNQVFTDLGNAIDEAKKTRNKGTNATGDREAFRDAIVTALNTLTTVRSTTTDATRVKDSTTLANAKSALADALDAFIASAEVKPIVDIDFSIPAELITKTDTAGVETESYVIKGVAGEMDFGANFDIDNNTGSYNFAQGVGEELTDRLHVGGDSFGTVTLPELGDNDVLEISFDLWFGQLGKAFQGIELRNAAGTRVAGFKYDSYNNNVEFNDFDNAEGTGMIIKGKVKSANDKSGGAAAVGKDGNQNTFKLVIDYKNKTIQGTVTNSSNTVEGVAIPMDTTATADNKIVSFNIGGWNHKKANGSAYGRRAWFDNLTIYRYADAAGDFEEDITDKTWAETTDWEETYFTTGIKTIAEKAEKVIYTMSGVRVAKAAKPGLYIVNGKKYLVK